MAIISFVPIIPKKISAKGFKKAIGRSLSKNNTAMAQDFRGVTNKWSSPRVTYKKEVSEGPTLTTGLLGVTVKPGDMAGSTSAVDKRLFFVNRGANITHKAILTSGWQPMTKPNTLQVQRRRGRVRGIAKGVPGGRITARNFDQSVARKRQKPFEESIRTELQKAANETF